MKLSQYLKMINLYDQVVNGIKKHFGTNTDIIQYTIGNLDDCEFKFMNSIRVAGDCKGLSMIRLHESVAQRPEDRKKTMLHELGHFIRNCRLQFYNKVDGGTVRFQYVSRGGYTGLRRVSAKKRSPHGTEWKAIVIDLGGVPDRCHTYDYLDEGGKQYKHKYICKDCGYEHKTIRKLKNISRRYHKGCSRKPNGGKFTHIELR